MPIITVNTFEGKPVEVKRELVRALTNAAVEVLKCKPEAVRIVLQEMKPENFSVAGKLKADG